LLAALAITAGAHKQFLDRDSGSLAACSTRDVASRSLIQSKMNTLDPVCETMCRSIGAYPNCKCPGFSGEPAAATDTRACAGKYCKSGVDQCPNDAFYGCVKDKTKVPALLQWDDILSRMDRTVTSVAESVKIHTDLAEAHDVAKRVFFQMKVHALTPTCEEMCNKVGAYPDCQCPGFAGAPASEQDTRACAGKYCKPSVEFCPTDAFVTCVADKTQIAALLQWDDLYSRFDHGMAAISKLSEKIYIK